VTAPQVTVLVTQMVVLVAPVSHTCLIRSRHTLLVTQTLLNVPEGQGGVGQYPVHPPSPLRIFTYQPVPYVTVLVQNLEQ
jgi:hypothetical protein